MKSNHYRRRGKSSAISLCLATILISLISIKQQQVVQAYSDASHYDPEGQDGIPILSARSLPSYSGWNEDVAKVAPQRRSSDGDLEDGLEEEDDDDRDEYKAGSSNHDSYENPAYEESRRAARDGDDIESFFDKHIGPDDATDSPADEGEVPIAELTGQRRGDLDDHHEAAASSPLSSILQSLLNHAHKSKLIITTDDPSSSSTSGESSTTTTDNSQTASSSATPVGSSSSYQIGTTPIAYFTPIAGSSGNQYAPSASASNDQAQAQEAEDEAPVREIYIGRRPQGGYVAQYQPVQYAPMSGQSSNANWRGSYPIVERQPVGYQQADYGAGVPVAASYAYNNREHPVAATQAPTEDEGSVTYGLSFGGSAFGDSSSNDEKAEADGATEDQTSADEPEQQPVAYAPHATRNNMIRHSSSMRSYDGYQYAPVAMTPQGYARVQQQYYGPQQYNQHQQLQGAVRYHRDPSESQRMIGYHPQQQQLQQQQYNSRASSSSPPAASSSQAQLTSQAARQQDYNDWATRQKLLASLDKQIKSNPYYGQGSTAATSLAGQYRMPSSSQIKQSRPQQDALANDYDTYNSYHKEVDPYRSLTRVSQTVSEPVANYGPQSNPLGLLIEEQQQRPLNPQHRQQQVAETIGNDNNGDQSSQRVNLRVRRDDSDERESDDDIDDGVWVDDDEDDSDNRQQSSDVNETAQDPEDETEEDQQEAGGTVSSLPAPAPGVIGGPHSYELSPNDLLVYQG